MKEMFARAIAGSATAASGWRIIAASPAGCSAGCRRTTSQPEQVSAAAAAGADLHDLSDGRGEPATASSSAPIPMGSTRWRCRRCSGRRPRSLPPPRPVVRSPDRTVGRRGFVGAPKSAMVRANRLAGGAYEVFARLCAGAGIDRRRRRWRRTRTARTTSRPRSRPSSRRSTPPGMSGTFGGQKVGYSATIGETILSGRRRHAKRRRSSPPATSRSRAIRRGR